MDLRARLRRIEERARRVASAAATREGSATAGDASDPNDRIDQGSATGRAAAVACADGTTHANGLAIRVTRYAPHAAHGASRLPLATELDAATLGWLFGSAQPVGASEALFLDTETTGLASGAGVYVFMVGMLWLDVDGPVLEQVLLTGPEHEAALLDHVAMRVAARPRLVTFFGKSFDRHRLDDRFALHRQPRRLTELPHLDLYHVGRRLLKRAWPDGKLRTFERRVLDLERPDDLPGEECPDAWLEWLQGRDDGRLARVFEHNRIDVLSLLALAAATVDVMLAPKDAVAAASAARLLCDRGADAARFEPLLERALSGLDSDRWVVDVEVKRAALDLARRRRARGESASALEVLRRLARAAPSDPDPLVLALAIAEKDLKDRALAREHALELRRRWLASSGPERAARGLAEVNRAIERLDA